MTTATEIKWDKIYSQAQMERLEVSEILAKHAFLLPKTGLALDLACGLGANALFLAQQGLETHAFDISSIALQKLQQQAKQQKLHIHCQKFNVEQDALIKNRFDVIVITRFLDRKLSHGIIDALKPNGLLFYQTFTQNKLSKAAPNNPDYLLAENELLKLFASLKVVYYQEYALTGHLDIGNRNEALFIGQKTPEN